MTVMAWSQRGIARFDPSDQPSLEAFQRANFGPGSLQVDRDHRRWLLADVPRRDPEGVQLWVCNRNGAVVGQQAGIPFTLEAGGQPRRASWAIDLMVAPEWRLRGVGPALSEAHVAASEVTVSLGISDTAYKSYRRAGWTDIGTIPTFLRVIDPLRCLRVSPYDGGLARLAARLGRPALAVAAQGYRLAALAAGSRLVEVPAFDERSDMVWRGVAGNHTLIARRDLAFLRWRFDASPAAGRLRRFYVMRRGLPVAFLVLRIDRWRGEPVGVVLDYLARPGWLMPAFAHLVALATRGRLSALLVRTLNTRAPSALSPMGFICLPNGLKTPTRAMVRTGPGGEDLAPVLADRDNWFITAADSDLGFRELGD
jgi:GNAT superfamily N-acetyltransferase